MKRLLLTTAVAVTLTSVANAERLHPETVATTPTAALLTVYGPFVHQCNNGNGDMCEAAGMIVGELSARGCQFSDWTGPAHLPLRWGCSP
jgi:hypothetical protein